MRGDDGKRKRPRLEKKGASRRKSRVTVVPRAARSLPARPRVWDPRRASSALAFARIPRAVWRSLTLVMSRVSRARRARAAFNTREVASGRGPPVGRASRDGARSHARAGSGVRRRARARARVCDARENTHLGTQVARFGEPRLLQAVAAVRGVESGPACAAQLRELGVAPRQTSTALVARPLRGLLPHDVRRGHDVVLAHRDRSRRRHAARIRDPHGTARRETARDDRGFSLFSERSVGQMSSTCVSDMIIHVV